MERDAVGLAEKRKKTPLPKDFALARARYAIQREAQRWLIGILALHSFLLKGSCLEI